MTSILVSVSGRAAEPPPVNPASSYMPVVTDEPTDAFRPGKRWLSPDEAQHQFIVGFGFA